MNRNTILPGPVVCTFALLFSIHILHGQQTATIPPTAPDYTIVLQIGDVRVSRANAFPLRFDKIADTNLYVGDHVRIGPNSQLALSRGQDIYRFYQQTEFQIQPPRTATSPPTSFRLLSGILYFFHRGKPSELEVETRTASAAIRGTEFTVAVDDAGTTVVSVIDGVVDLANLQGVVLPVTSGQSGVVVPGQPPVLRPAIDAINVIQWTLYYPGVLDPQELQLTADERTALSASITAYQSGDLLQALAQYPVGRVPRSDPERIYRAALVLTVGQVDDAQPLLAAVPRPAGTTPDTNARLAAALEQLIDAVKLRATAPQTPPELATEWLAESYRLQSLAQLDGALNAARQAAAKSPQFGFAWARVAELEFSFGRIRDASRALDNALEFSPRNAQAVTLGGFLSAARNNIRSAIIQFDMAIDLDPGLANAWLGRGLCYIRTRRPEAGRQDLLTAAALEPQRALLRSYLGKAWADAPHRQLAEHELELAKHLDPRDPTAWLYSALLKQDHNEINDAIRDLEHAQDLNTNRAVFRSQLLLDQDRAVRSANLAHIYRDAGMIDWSVREASRAVSDDYANFSAHLFLANSYDQLRDPNRINLRYETPAESEYLIANLLSPIGAGPLSQSISQQEYSKLFERNRLGIVSSTEYLSRGAWTQNGAQFGLFGNTSYSFEGLYRFDPGQRINNDFEERELRLHIKQQLTPNDILYLRVANYELNSGDVFQFYDPTLSYVDGGPNLELRVHEEQDATLTLGYQHEWSPNSRTLVLASRFDDTYEVQDPQAVILLTTRVNDMLRRIRPINSEQSIRTERELYSIEAQHILETVHHTAIFGGRFQSGDAEVHNLHFQPLEFQDVFPDPPVAPDVEPRLERVQFYAYDHWRIHDSFVLIGGLSYDHIRFPANVRSTPMSEDESVTERVSPKAGFVWTPTLSTAIRGAYTRSLAGESLDQSIRLEPTQVAGLNQAYRSIIPETVVGANAGAPFETYQLYFDQKFKTGTYLGIGGELLHSSFDRTLGTYELNRNISDQFIFSSVQEDLDYKEKNLFVNVDQIFGKEFAIGLQYRLTDAHLDKAFPEARELTSNSSFPYNQQLESALQQVRFHAIYNHSSGLFTVFETLWNHQNNRGYDPDRPGDDFWQLNFFAGYRFPHRRAQITLGILNLLDQDYRLNPLTLYNELPRERTFYGRFQFSF